MQRRGVSAPVRGAWITPVVYTSMQHGSTQTAFWWAPSCLPSGTQATSCQTTAPWAPTQPSCGQAALSTCHLPQLWQAKSQRCLAKHTEHIDLGTKQQKMDLIQFPGRFPTRRQRHVCSVWRRIPGWWRVLTVKSVGVVSRTQRHRTKWQETPRFSGCAGWPVAD